MNFQKIRKILTFGCPSHHTSVDDIYPDGQSFFSLSLYPFVITSNTAEHTAVFRYSASLAVTNGYHKTITDRNTCITFTDCKG